MKILFTITGPWGTGAATVVDGVVQELQNLGHRVKVVFPDLGLPSPDCNKYYGNLELYHIIKFPVEYQGSTFPTFPLIVPDPNPRNIKNAWTFKDMTDMEFAGYIDFLKFRLHVIIQEFQPDIIETEHVWLTGYVLNELGYTYIVGAHNSDQMGFRYDPRMRPYATACAINAKYVFAISDTVKEECLKLYDVPDEKVLVIPNGYDKNIFQPHQLSKGGVFQKHGIEADVSLPVVTFGGKMSKTKGVDVLFAANAILQKRQPCTLLFFGSGDITDVLGRGPTREEKQNAYLIGHVTQDVIAEFHNIAEFSVLPSREEGFAVAALEAMGCGLPVVATDIPSLKDLIVGKTVPAEDPMALAEAMESMLNLTASEKKNLTEMSLKRALEFGWKKNTEMRLNYYKASI
ncbi:MAG: glycosyltransferase family 4 protein [Candidatus Aminicenantes bacterium]|nr:MAG: glycosyltransferase family 4 protein [Candidatus Aminicenantes bacterium]